MTTAICGYYDPNTPAERRLTIAADDSHACAVASGQAYCWGANGISKLGDGTTADSHVPVMVGNSTGSTSITTYAFDNPVMF